jgi:hypothetical protein
MYASLRSRPAEPAGSVGDSGVRSSRKARVAAPVVFLGLTSLLTDISSELVATVLPLYLTLQLGLSPLAFGFIDGLYQGVTAVVRIGGGFVADRTRRPKGVAVLGYTASALAKLALLPATTFGALAAVIAVDRAGKGVRTAPRDALIAASSSSAGLGRSFGVHPSDGHGRRDARTAAGVCHACGHPRRLRRGVRHKLLFRPDGAGRTRADGAKPPSGR